MSPLPVQSLRLAQDRAFQSSKGGRVETGVVDCNISMWSAFSMPGTAPGAGDGAGSRAGVLSGSLWSHGWLQAMGSVLSTLLS